MLTIQEHLLLRAKVFITRFPTALGELNEPQRLALLMKLEASAPLKSDDNTRAAIRDLLRHGGYKPTGRGKPASEYLLRAATEGTLAPINSAVDACNVVSLHSGLPISVIDLNRAESPFRIAIAKPGESYIFNASGQEIDLEGLICLYDSQEPCANAVKDAQRTKTHPGTTATLSVIWSSTNLGDRVDRAVAWYHELLSAWGVEIQTLI